MDYFFSPQTIAIIGASHVKGKIGYTILENFIRSKYPGKIFPVNPNVNEILGLRVYPSVKNIPQDIDLAIIAVPAKIVPKVLKECVEKKVKGVIIVSGGFSEIGKEGKKLEEKLKKIIKGKKTRVLGPNCLGALDTSSKLDTLFHPLEKLVRPKEGNIGFISQSGAVGSVILDIFSEEQIGISKFISYENALDIDESDCIEFLGKDEKTKIILLFLEGVKDGKKFLRVAKKVSQIKPIIVLKGGKTEKGRKAALSHTGSLAGSARIYSSVFKQVGIIEANTHEELIDFAKAFSQPLPKGNRIAIVTDGGGFGVLACDEAERQGLKLPEPSNKLKKIFRKIFPEHVILSNPIDLTGDVTTERFRIAIEECLKSKEFDGVITITLFQVPALEKDIVDAIANLKKYGKPILCCAAGGRFTLELSKALEKNGIPVYPSPERAVKAMAALVNYSRMKGWK
jgi:acetyl coenzyme A synthetase (ADP forming)-like protein